jgi:hypothetical protein
MPTKFPTFLRILEVISEGVRSKYQAVVSALTFYKTLSLSDLEYVQ